MALIAFVTSEEIGGFIEPDKLVLPHLEEAGHIIESAAWSDPSVDWTNYDCVVIRSPWDYYKKIDEYQKWLQECQKNNIKLLNPAHIVLSNVDKKYLLDFAKQGIKIVPTEYIAKLSGSSLQAILEKRDWDEVVIKPTVSAGSWDTWRSSKSSVEQDEIKFTEQKNKHHLFIQPFLPEIITDGEYSVIYFNGKLSHVVRKLPKAGDYRIQVQYGGRYSEVELLDEILEQTQKVIDLIPERLLYARVDGIIRDNQFLLMELEINEPDLYFNIAKEAAKNFSTNLLEVLAS